MKTAPVTSSLPCTLHRTPPAREYKLWKSRLSHKRRGGLRAIGHMRHSDCRCWSLWAISRCAFASDQQAGGASFRRNDGFLGTPYAKGDAPALPLGGVTPIRSETGLDPGRISVGREQPSVRSGAAQPIYPVWALVPAAGGARHRPAESHTRGG